MRKLSCLLLSLLLLTGCIRTTSPSAEEIALPSDISSEISDEAEDSPIEDDLPAQPDDQPQATFFLRLAYLPVNAVPAQTDSLLSDYREQLAALDAVILNTGVYWNQDGELAISSEWLQTVQTLQPTIDLWCTVNPKGALIREGAAGQTLATEEQRSSGADGGRLCRRVSALRHRHRLGVSAAGGMAGFCRFPHKASCQARGQDALAGALPAAALSVRAGSLYVGVCGRFRQHHGL